MKGQSGFLTIGAVFFAAAMCSPLLAQTQPPLECPPGSLRLIVPFGPGGTIDRVARAFAAKLAPVTQIATCVDNVPGSVGRDGMLIVANAKPDGKILLIHSAQAALTGYIHSKRSVDPAWDLAPIARLASDPFVLIVGSFAPIRSVPELLKSAKGDGLSFGTYWVGSPAHILSLNLLQASGTPARQVPVRSP